MMDDAVCPQNNLEKDLLGNTPLVECTKINLKYIEEICIVNLPLTDAPYTLQIGRKHSVPHAQHCCLLRSPQFHREVRPSWRLPADAAWRALEVAARLEKTGTPPEMTKEIREMIANTHGFLQDEYFNDGSAVDGFILVVMREATNGSQDDKDTHIRSWTFSADNFKLTPFDVHSSSQSTAVLVRLRNGSNKSGWFRVVGAADVEFNELSLTIESFTINSSTEESQKITTAANVLTNLSGGNIDVLKMSHLKKSLQSLSDCIAMLKDTLVRKNELWGDNGQETQACCQMATGNPEIGTISDISALKSAHASSLQRVAALRRFFTGMSEICSSNPPYGTPSGVSNSFDLSRQISKTNDDIFAMQLTEIAPLSSELGKLKKQLMTIILREIYPIGNSAVTEPLTPRPSTHSIVWSTWWPAAMDPHTASSAPRRQETVRLIRKLPVPQMDLLLATPLIVANMDYIRLGHFEVLGTDVSSLMSTTNHYLMAASSIPGDKAVRSAVSTEVVSAGLGFVVHVVAMASKYLDIPLRYRFSCQGSRSSLVELPYHLGKEGNKRIPLIEEGRTAVELLQPTHRSTSLDDVRDDILLSPMMMLGAKGRQSVLTGTDFFSEGVWVLAGTSPPQMPIPRTAAIFPSIGGGPTRPTSGSSRAFWNQPLEFPLHLRSAGGKHRFNVALRKLISCVRHLLFEAGYVDRHIPGESEDLLSLLELLLGQSNFPCQQVGSTGSVSPFDELF